MTRKKGQSRPEGAAQLISLTPCLIQTLLDGLQLHLELLVLHRQPAVGILEECLEVLYALVACEQLALRDAGLLLERRILVDELQRHWPRRISNGQASATLPSADVTTHLLLDNGKLLQIAFQERHLLLLRLTVRVADDVVVLLLDFVKLDLELDDLRG